MAIHDASGTVAQTYVGRAREYPTTLAVPLEVEISFEGGGFVSVTSPVAAEIATEKID